MAVAIRDTDVDRGREHCFRFAADGAAPSAAREAVDVALDGIEPGARLTVGVLTRAAVAACVRGRGGLVRVDVLLGPEIIRVEVSGAGDGFSLPADADGLDELSLLHPDPRPFGSRSYLLDRLAEEWGIERGYEAVWFEVDHASPSPRRHRSRTLVAVS